jgi:2-(1,2-epoxy-1,2-dihydrophenyl)acetyl-CoA isomerase
MQEIILEKRDGGAFVTFNRPDVRNALNPGMLSAMSEFLTTIRDDSAVRYLVLQGAGGNFSAGGDVAAYAEALALPPEQRREFFESRVRGNADSFLLLEQLTIPVISMVRGAAAGAGLSFLLASDFVLAASDAVLLFAQPRLGLPLDLSMTYYLPRTVGAKFARQLAFTGARLDAERAMQLGIVDAVHRAEELDAALAKLVKSFSATSPGAAGHTKRLINTNESVALADQMEREVKAIGECVVAPDFAEGVSAFMEKRPAVFTGIRGS